MRSFAKVVIPSRRPDRYRADGIGKRLRAHPVKSCGSYGRPAAKRLGEVEAGQEAA